MIQSLIEGAKTSGDTIAGTAMRHIFSIEDMHDALREYFENGQSHMQKNKGKNKVYKFELFKHKNVTVKVAVLKKHLSILKG